MQVLFVLVLSVRCIVFKGSASGMYATVNIGEIKTKLIVFACMFINIYKQKVVNI